MATIKAQKIPRKKADPEEIKFTVLYYYPQFSYAQVNRMGYKRVSKLLSVVRKEQAMYYLNMTKIVAAPNTRKGSGVKKLQEQFSDIIKS